MINKVCTHNIIKLLHHQLTFANVKLFFICSGKKVGKEIGLWTIWAYITRLERGARTRGNKVAYRRHTRRRGRQIVLSKLLMVILTDVGVVISDDIIHYGCCDGSGRVSRKEILDKICDNLSDTSQYVSGANADGGRGQ